MSFSNRRSLIGSPGRRIAVAAFGSPWLEGQSELYLKTQLLAFVSGSRQNDISSQMRNVARAMTPEEIDEAAKYYANKEPPFLASQ